VTAGPPLLADPAWEPVLARVRAARVVLVLGESDTGKTSLVTYLATALLADARSVAVVDADLGQSVIGPPTTVGLGELRAPMRGLLAARVRGLAFVGATSPVAHAQPTVLATGRMAERARGLGVDHVLVDTSGLIQGETGRLLKQRKIDRVAPDLVLCLQRDGECEHILRAYAGRSPAILRLAAAHAVRLRSTDERRRWREAAFARYFADARSIELDARRVVSDGSWRPGDALASPDVLVGLDGPDGETLGLGVVREVDVAGRALLVETPVPAAGIAVVRPSGMRLPRLHTAEPGVPATCTTVNA
jgi:polynucleotide 5'-hydroxyl-kinase GRC3/NOL9